ncbi:transcription factor MYB27-like [Chenopodium quinoa]|uniref:transcription factor MYB27-like n=1 Tax=Chenopodium quinoa TaxID=63459 RepID=UPI000B7904E8|nr:transcription factor MYB27-like [Chenopodium quinoa]
MGEENLRKGPWYEEEDERLKTLVAVLGARRWDTVAKISGLSRSGKSCRLRWLNYLRPCLKHGSITSQEELLILQLHQRWGNKWAKIARRLPGRTDNEVKNYWRTHLRKKMQMQFSLLNHSISSPTRNVSSSIETSSSSEERNNYSNRLDMLIQEGNMITPQISSNNTNTKSTDENIEAITSNYYVDCNDKVKGLSDCMNTNLCYTNRLSDCMITSSPYENRVSDWLNTVSRDVDQTDKYNPGCWEISDGLPDLCLSYPTTWCIEDASAWDFLDTTWDMDLFN